MNKYDIRVGQVLWLNAGAKGKFLVKVTKINQKNVKCIRENGQGWSVHPSYLSLATAAEADSFSESPVGTEAVLGLGVAVRFKPGTSLAESCKYPVLVVIGNHAGAWRLAPLGGDGGRYYRGINASQVEVVNLQMEGM